MGENKLLRMENASLVREVNSLRNLIRSMPATKETKHARAVVGERRWENQIEHEGAHVPHDHEPLYRAS